MLEGHGTPQTPGPLIIQKFGGTSLADASRIERAAETILEERARGHQVIVVVSAMAGTTDTLVRLCREIGGDPRSPSGDTVLAAGEQITAGLLSLALQKRGVQSRALCGWQIPILTNTAFGEAEIIDVSSDILRPYAQAGHISVVTGFQGVTPQGQITTLGRGGSDTTAVALAAFLGAARCDIYTDVDGVYSADPRLVTEAQKMNLVSYDDMMALSHHGAKVLHPRSVAYAKDHQIPLRVLSSLSLAEGTLISVPPAEHKPMLGLTYTRGWTRITCTPSTPKGQRVWPLLQAHAPQGSQWIYTPESPPRYQAFFNASQLPLLGTTLNFETDVDSIDDQFACVSVVAPGLALDALATLRQQFLGVFRGGHMCAGFSATSLRWGVFVPEDAVGQLLRVLHETLRP